MSAIENTDDRKAKEEGDRTLMRSSLIEDKPVRVAIIGSFLILLFGVLYFAKSLLLPVMLAFVFMLIFSPVVRAGRRRGVPESVTAALVVLMIGSAGIAGVYSLSEPVGQWMADAPRIGFEVRAKLRTLMEPVNKLKEAEKQVEEATSQPPESDVQKVVVQEPGLLSRAAQGAPEVAAGAGLTLVLLLFLLASGDMFVEKLVRVLPTLKDKKRGLRIARDIEREVSRYLLTITSINAGLGLAVAIAFHLIGMPNPLMWGVVVAGLNFIPYVGAVIGLAITGVVALLSFATLGQALLAPAIYLALNVVESQVVTPALVGHRLQINAVFVILAVALWGWLWGVPGVFLAVPALIIVKVFALHVDGLGALHEFLGPRNSEARGEA